MIWFVGTIHVIVCLVLIGVVLLQQGKSADLAGAFRRAGFSNRVRSARSRQPADQGHDLGGHPVHVYFDRADGSDPTEQRRTLGTLRHTSAKERPSQTSLSRKVELGGRAAPGPAANRHDYQACSEEDQQK